MTKIITLILESEDEEELRTVINDIVMDCSGYIKSIQIDEIKERQIEVPKVFNY